jgi:hypothetical protein
MVVLMWNVVSSPSYSRSSKRVAGKGGLWVFRFVSLEDLHFYYMGGYVVGFRVVGHFIFGNLLWFIAFISFQFVLLGVWWAFIL